MISKQQILDLISSQEWDNANFKQIENPPYPNKQLCALIKLQELGLTTTCSIAAAEHDLVYFDAEVDDLRDKCNTIDDVLYLGRCGVMFYEDSLAMFV
jgi:hypothetical protein